jgi:simple sugar transport system ATP-binding protein
MIDFTEAEERLWELFSGIGCTIDPGVKIARLDTLERQLIDIAKALFRESGVIILDEPTSLLAPPQVEKLFRVLEEVKKEKTVILVTHRIAEVEMIVDDIAVLRGGELVLAKEKSKTGRKEMIKAIIGSERGLPEKKILKIKTGGGKKKKKEAALLELNSISTARYSNDAGLNSFSLSLMPGEIVGLTGLPGNGQTSLLSMLSGIFPPESGNIIFEGRRYSRKKYKNLRNEPLGFIFPERDKQGLILSMKLVDNLLLNRRQLKRFSKRGIIDYRKLREFSAKTVKKYRIRSADAEKDVSILSGGNRQKVVLARETTSDVDVIIAAEPVRGLDIKAAEDVKLLFLEMKRNGKSVLIISGDMEFLFSLCDSIGVLYRGELKEINQTRRLSVETLGKAMLGYS